MKINADSLLILAAVGAAAAMLLAPKAAKATAAVFTSAPRATGSAGSVWDSAATSRYRDQLARELGGTMGEFYI